MKKTEEVDRQGQDKEPEHKRKEGTIEAVEERLYSSR